MRGSDERKEERRHFLDSLSAVIDISPFQVTLFPLSLLFTSLYLLYNETGLENYEVMKHSAFVFGTRNGKSRSTISLPVENGDPDFARQEDSDPGPEDHDVELRAERVDLGRDAEDHVGRVEGGAEGDGHGDDPDGVAAHEVVLVAPGRLDGVVDADAEGHGKHSAEDGVVPPVKAQIGHGEFRVADGFAVWSERLFSPGISRV